MKYTILMAAVLFLQSSTSMAQDLIDIAPPPTVGPDSFGFEQVDVMPEFPGGSERLHSFLASNINYPEEAKENGLEGRVYVEFVVCEDGSLCNERVMGSFDKACSNEVLRVVSKMPAWKPAEKDGKKVKTKYRLPVVFKLDYPEPLEPQTE